jgi:DIS3-like exonuclease 2
VNGIIPFWKKILPLPLYESLYKFQPIDLDCHFLSLSPYLLVSCGSVDGIRGEASESMGDGRTCNAVPASLSNSSSKQQVVYMHHPNEHGLTGVSNVAFYSMPTMHISEQADSVELLSIPNQRVSDFGRRAFSLSCPEPLACGLPGTFTNKDLFPFPHIEGSRKKYFDPHWSMEAVNEALKVSLKTGLDVLIYV